MGPWEVPKKGRDMTLPPVAKFSIADRWYFEADVPAIRDGARVILLTLHEWRLMLLLARSEGRIVNRSEASVARRGVDTLVKNLRAKLGQDFPILTVYGAGYRLAECRPIELVQ